MIASRGVGNAPRDIRRHRSGSYIRYTVRASFAHVRKRSVMLSRILFAPNAGGPAVAAAPAAAAPKPVAAAPTAPAPVAPPTAGDAGDTGKKKKEKKAKEQRPVYPIQSAKDASGNSIAKEVDGRFVLTAIPAEVRDASGALIQPAYSGRDYAKLQSKDFADEPTFIRFRAVQLRARASLFLKKADELDKNAEEYSKFGDPSVRKSVEKARKLADQLKELQAELAKSGIQL